MESREFSAPTVRRQACLPFAFFAFFCGQISEFGFKGERPHMGLPYLIGL